MSGQPTGNAVPEKPRTADEINLLAPNVWPRNLVRNPDGQVSVAGVTVGALAEQFGTPLFVIDEDDFRSRCREIAGAFGVASTCTTPERRSCAPRLPAGSRKRACASTSPPVANWPWPCTPSSRLGESPCTATTNQFPN